MIEQVQIVNLNISEGNDKTFPVVITESGTSIPLDISSFVFLYTAKKNKEDSDDDAVISQTIFPSAGSAVSGLTDIVIDRDDTLNKNLGVLFHDYQMDSISGGNRTTIFIGNLTVKQSIGDRNVN